MIVVQAPLRISLFGGGTDFPSYFANEGGYVLSSTIDKYIFVTIKKRFDRKLRVGYTETEMVDKLDDIQHELIREALRTTGIKEGVEVTTMGDIPSAGSGLGSSSAVTVGALQAMYTFLGEIATTERLAQEACGIEIGNLNKPIGIQDQYIAAFGGLRFIEFTRDGKVLIERIMLDPSTQRQLDDNLLLFYTGITRQSDSILAEQKSNIPNRSTVLSEMKALAVAAREELLDGNVDAIGHFLHVSWGLKKKLASLISNSQLDEMYATARKAGAIGGKITGAGGGGFLLLYCPRERQDPVRAALQPLQELPFRLENDGSKVIFNYQRSTDGSATPERTRWTESDLRMSTFGWKDERESKNSTEIKSEDHDQMWKYVAEMQQTLGTLPVDEITQTVRLLRSARLDGQQIFIMGNGGSAATASHFACDLGKNTKQSQLPAFRAIALTDNMPTITAYANDEGYENVFANQLANLVRLGDVVIGISTSGKSSNVVEAIQLASERGATTIAFTGFDAGKLGRIVDINIHIRSDSIEQVEDIHLILEHMIIKALNEMPEDVQSFRPPVILEKDQGDVLFDLEERTPALQTEAVLEGDRNVVELLYTINRALTGLRDLNLLLSRILELTLEGIGATSGSVMVVDERGIVIESAVVYEGKSQICEPEQLEDIFNHGLAGWVVKYQEAALVANTRDDPRWFHRSWEEDHSGSRSAISAPLAVGARPFGVLTLVQSEADQFTADDLAVLSAVALCISMNSAPMIVSVDE